MKYFLIAGEASGDLHGSRLIEAIKHHDTEATFVFLGGDAMAQAAGTQPVIHYREMAYMGFWQVIKHLSSVFTNLKTASKTLTEQKPDALILIDYPSFNLRMAARAFKAGVPVYYYIPPKVWAWKEWRVKKIKRLVNKLFAIFPFEVDFYRSHGMEVQYVGNPSVTEVAAAQELVPPLHDFLNMHKLRDRPIVALLPGSRKAEIKKNLKIMCRVMKRFPQYRGVVAGAPAIEDEFYAQCTDLPVVRDATIALLTHARAALVTSGTATLETALTAIPQVVMYRANGSKLSYEIMKRVLKVKFVSLPNLVCDRQIVPEMLLHECNVDNVSQALSPLLRFTPIREAQELGYKELKHILGSRNAAETTAEAIVNDLKKMFDET
ncbi:MAG: lipid-A-disaccharide synthase [Muribaculaceae bacterium]|nr:lipid-A-disaccharide synthase [Muribaculaceae bacterium]